MRGVCLNTLWHLVTGFFEDRYYWARIFFIKFINDMKFWRYNKQYCTMVKLINFRLFILFFCPNNYCAVDIIILKIINYWSWNLCIALNTEYNILICFFLFQELADVDNVKTTTQHHQMLWMSYYSVCDWPMIKIEHRFCFRNGFLCAKKTSWRF